LKDKTMKIYFLMQRLSLSVLLLASVATYSKNARADALDASLTQLVKALDANGDGGVNRDELQAMSRRAKSGDSKLDPSAVFLQNFSDIDADKDGALSATEMSNMITARYKKADRSSKEQLALGDAFRGMPFVAKNFSAIDTAGKGSVSLQQVRDFFAEQMQAGVSRLAAARQ
jgi:Ca2+-binding EF-hand superfamily protein